MPTEEKGQPDPIAIPPRDNQATPSSLVPSTPANIGHGGLRALTAILVAERKKQNQAVEKAPLSDRPSEG
jgi:hypothetical protein